jgi:hypothetical protein
MIINYDGHSIYYDESAHADPEEHKGPYVNGKRHKRNGHGGMLGIVGIVSILSVAIRVRITSTENSEHLDHIDHVEQRKLHEHSRHSGAYIWEPTCEPSWKPTSRHSEPAPRSQLLKGCGPGLQICA